MAPRERSLPVPLDQSLEPLVMSGEIVTDTSQEVENPLDRVGELIGECVQAFFFQDHHRADVASKAATELLTTAEALTSDPDELVFIRVIKVYASIWGPFARGVKFLQEGRFKAASEEMGKANAACSLSLKHYEEWRGLNPRRELEDLAPIIVTLRALKVFVDASELSLPAMELLYKRAPSEYFEEVKKISEICKEGAETLPATTDEPASTFRKMLMEMADRLAYQVEIFGKQPQVTELTPPTSKKVFVIHGHDEAKWRELRDILEDDLHLETVELSDQSDRGRTIIQKFEDHAKECGFAFALMTPDDLVEKEEAKYRQARPNVLLELGWFFGRFGRDRVCIVCKKGTNIPSDLQGVLYVQFQDMVKEGFREIQSTLQSAEILGKAKTRSRARGRRQP